MYPTSRVVDATYYAFESRTSTDDITLVLDDVRDGRPYRVEIHTWMRVSDAEQSSVEEDRRTATLRTTLYSAPADAFDHEYLRREVAFVVHLEREGWDFELGACLKKAWWIHYAQYIGAEACEETAGNGAGEDAGQVQYLDPGQGSRHRTLPWFFR